MTVAVLGMAAVMAFGMARVDLDRVGDVGTARTPAEIAVAVAVPVVAAAAINHRELECLASAIWYEAGNQPNEGRVAVAEVVIARTRSGLYPKRACAVIAQRSQFSFVRNGVIPAVPVDKADEMKDIALDVIRGRRSSRAKGALWFHATYVDPGWDVPRIGRIGDHIFYGRKA